MQQNVLIMLSYHKKSEDCITKILKRFKENVRNYILTFKGSMIIWQ